MQCELEKPQISVQVVLLSWKPFFPRFEQRVILKRWSCRRGPSIPSSRASQRSLANDCLRVRSAQHVRKQESTVGSGPQRCPCHLHARLRQPSMRGRVHQDSKKHRAAKFRISWITHPTFRCELQCEFFRKEPCN